MVLSLPHKYLNMNNYNRHWLDEAQDKELNLLLCWLLHVGDDYHMCSNFKVSNFCSFHGQFVICEIFIG